MLTDLLQLKSSEGKFSGANAHENGISTVPASRDGL